MENDLSYNASSLEHLQLRTSGANVDHKNYFTIQNQNHCMECAGIAGIKPGRAERPMYSHHKSP
jgi:hypothetical protein